MVRRFVVCLALLLSGVLGASQSHQHVLAQSGFAVSSFGIKYSDPSEYFTQCGNYSWLHGGNYTQGCGGTITPTQQLSADLSFISQQHLGSFLRVWISLDQLFDQSKWSATTGFGGWDPSAFANLDDALHQFASAGIKIELGMLAWETTCDPSLTAASSVRINCFHPEALDGLHAQMRQNYLTAVQQFVQHIAADPQDMAAIAAIDTQSEAYYQDEVYFNVLGNYPDDSHLRTWNYSMPSWPTSTQCYTLGNTVCTGGAAGKGCVSGSHVDTTCVDVNIIEPWLHDLYTTIKAAAPTMTVTVGDTGRLLTTDTRTYTGQAHWISLYSPVSDVYDIHLYSDDPWDYTSRWATWTNLDKPYFVGEAGCATNNNNCTYNTGPISAPLKWWLNNLTQNYGARSVEVEDTGTVWDYQYVNGTGAVPNLTPSGAVLQTLVSSPPPPPPPPTSTSTATPTSPPPTNTPSPTATPTSPPPPTSTPTSTPNPTASPPATSGSLFSNGFDAQSTGALVTGSGTNQFSSVSGSSQLVVETALADSAPNALSVGITTKPASATKYYTQSTSTQSLQLHLQLSKDFAIPSSSSMVLVQTAPGSSSSVGRVQVALSGQRAIYLTYVDSTGKIHYLYTSGTVSLGAWHTLLLKEGVGQGTGSLSVSLDGTQLASGSKLDVGSGGIGTITVGEASTTATSGTAGHLYLDDVLTTS